MSDGCPVSDVRCQVAGVSYQCQLSTVRRVRCHASGSGVRCQMPGVRCQVSGVRYQVSSVTCPVSVVRCQVSDVKSWTLAWALDLGLGFTQLRVSSWDLPGATWGLPESFLTFEGACELVLEPLLGILLRPPGFC